MSTIKLEMIPEDIDKGVAGDASQCPITQMVLRNFSFKTGVIIYTYDSGIEIHSSRNHHWHHNLICKIPMPPEGKKFIGQFDRWGNREESLARADADGHPGVLVEEVYTYPEYKEVRRRIRHLKKPEPIVLELEVDQDCLKEVLA